jgi:hypothetical protein
MPGKALIESQCLIPECIGGVFLFDPAGGIHHGDKHHQKYAENTDSHTHPGQGWKKSLKKGRF